MSDFIQNVTKAKYSTSKSLPKRPLLVSQSIPCPSAVCFRYAVYFLGVVNKKKLAEVLVLYYGQSPQVTISAASAVLHRYID